MKHHKIRIGSWNVGTLTGKLLELVDSLVRGKIDIACFQETKWKGKSTREGNGYKLWYSGSDSARNGVGIIMAERLKDNVVHVDRCTDRIMLVRLVIEEETLNVISAYAPQPGLGEAEKKSFWDSLDEIVRGCPEDQRLLLGGDLNGHIGAEADGYSGAHGGFGFGVRNEEGRTLLEFATAHDLVVANSFFKKRDTQLITFQSGRHCTQIDYFLVRKGDFRACKDCKVLPREECYSQHRLLVMDILVSRRAVKNEKIVKPRIMWKNLKGEAAEMFRETVTRRVKIEMPNFLHMEADQMWNSLAGNMRETAKEALGVTAGITRCRKACRESWWISEEVQTKVAAKKTRFRELIRSRNGTLEDWSIARERYSEAKREAKKSVAKAKQRAYEELYRRLESKGGENDIYRIAKARERRRRDLGNIKYIKDESGRSIVKEDDIRKRWEEYFITLFNGRRPEQNEEEEYYRTYPHPLINDDDTRISKEEVSLALRKMGRNKAVGPDQIPIEAWRCLGEVGVSWLTSLFNKMLTSVKMPEEWRLSEVIPIYKNKGDVQICSNYRGIKLLSHTMKLWERVIEMKLRRVTKVAEYQFGFMPGRSTTEAIHIIRSLMEKHRERQRTLHFAFLDLEKAYDSVPRELIWRTLRAKGVTERYLSVIKDMYERAMTCVRTPVGNTEFFPVEVGLHQGSALSPYLFNLILDDLSKGLQEETPWCLIFADDIVLVSRTAEELNRRLEQWRGALEDNGLHISREKTEYLRCDFDKEETRQNEGEEVRIGDQILHSKESFRYLGSVLHKSGRIDEDVAHRIQVGWLKWRAATGVLCDKRIPLKLKGKFYRVAIRPAMLYGSECWPMTKAQANRMEVAEMRMLRWTCGKTLLDGIPTGVFRAQLEVGTITNKLREGRLRWYGHVKRREQTAPLRRVESILVDGVRRRGRPKLRWEDRLENDLKELCLSKDMTSDRNTWRIRIRVDE